MKILAFTDIHTDKEYLKIIAKKAKHVDLLVCSGDFTIFMEGFEEVVGALEKMKKPVLLLHGNHEDERAVNKIKSKYIIPFHKVPYQHKEYLFLAHGGGGFSLKSKQLEKRIPKFKEVAKKFKKITFVSHAPPFGTELDYLPWAGHVGCKTVTKVIKEVKPHIFLCGHLHENFGVHQELGKTLMINPGPEGVVIEI